MVKAERVLRALEWYQKVKEYFEPFDPEIKNVSINYKSKKCEIRQAISVPARKMNQLGNFQLPAFKGFRIKEVISGNFEKIDDVFTNIDGVWRCDPTKLVGDEDYLLYLEGDLDKAVLNELVRIQPARNRDQTEEVDRYWLDVMIKNVEIWETMWKYLDVEDVSVNVNVSLDRCFSTIYPKELKERIKITREFLEAGRGLNQNELSRAWWRFRRSYREKVLSGQQIIDIARKFLNSDVFPEYLVVDDPYSIGRVLGDEIYTSRTLPEFISVTAETDLNYKNPMATGYLTFNKNMFIDVIKKALEEILN